MIELLKLLKFKIGIMSNKRDDYLSHLLNSVISELEEVYGIESSESEYYKSLVVDFAEFKYSNRGEYREVPEYIRCRIKDLFIKTHSRRKDE